MNFLKKLKLKIRLKLRTVRGSDSKVTGLPKLIQKTMFLGKGKIIFGEHVTIGWKNAPGLYSNYAFICSMGENSEISIGDNTYINNSCILISYAEKIHIGNNCRIGYNFKVQDSDFHGLTVETRDLYDAIVNKPVKIGDNVFVGNDVTVLKGVTIGDGAVIGSGSIVTKDVQPYTIVAGNPARFIRDVYERKEQ